MVPIVFARDVHATGGNLGSLLNLPACASWARKVARGDGVTFAEHNAVVASFAFAADIFASPSIVHDAAGLFDVERLPDTSLAGAPSRTAIVLGRRSMSFEDGDLSLPVRGAFPDDNTGTAGAPSVVSDNPAGVIDVASFTTSERREKWELARACLRMLSSGDVEFMRGDGTTHNPAGWVGVSGDAALVAQLPVALVGDLAAKAFVPNGEAAAHGITIREPAAQADALAFEQGRVADYAAWFATGRAAGSFPSMSARMTAQSPLSGTRAEQANAEVAHAIQANREDATFGITKGAVLGGLLLGLASLGNKVLGTISQARR
jgi:hypothetical protein